MNNGSAPAFPVLTKDHVNGHQDGPMGNHWQYPGLSKRELFAIHVLNGIMSNEAKDTDGDGDPERRAKQAVKYADALIDQLSQTQNDLTPLY